MDGTWAVEELDALEVVTGVPEIVSVANTSVGLSATGKLNAGMLDRAVIVGRTVEVPVATAVVPNPSSPPIPPVAPVSSIRARALSDKWKVVNVCHKRRRIH